MARRSLTSWLPAPKRTRRPRPFLGIEYLEDRIVPDGSLPPDLVVGRTLSAYTVAGVQNRTLDITYTVYNQRAEDLSGVLLTTALQPGVAYQSASTVPDRSGPELAWSLGTVRGFDRASVTVTVTLPQTPPLQIDSGAKAFATLNAGAVSADTPAATLSNRAIAPELLASTPDANTADPFVQEQAAKLRYDPQQIVQYLSTDVGYESYAGSLRGARGTLWSAAGNALDEASLGVALLRGSGIPARYAHGTLSDALSRQLILTMFPASYQTVGYVPAGTAVADPANDPLLLAETRDHYWVQLDTGTGFVSADTSGLAGSGMGASFTTTTDTFAAVADGLRHKVRVKLDAETYNQAAALLGAGNGLGTTTVLDHTFNAVELVGKPLSVAHHISRNTAGFIFTATTNTYTPYLVVSDAAARDPSQADILTGTAYQEVLTNFPLGTQVLTGLFLTVGLVGAGQPAEEYRRALFDRIGYAVRRNGGAPVSSPDARGTPAFTPFDVFTLDALPGRASPGARTQYLAALERSAEKLEAVRASGTLTDGVVADMLAAAVAQTAAIANAVAVNSDLHTAQLAAFTKVRAYLDRPRLTIVSSVAPVGSPGSASRLQVDLRRDTVRSLAAPGQDGNVPVGFQALRGVYENVVETNVLQAALTPPGGQPRPVVSTVTVFEAAAAAGVPLVSVTPDDPAALDPLAISAEAKARITEALGRGKAVVVPAAAVAVDGAARTAWYEIDPATGETIGVTEDGGHSAIVALSAALLVSAILVAVEAAWGDIINGVVLGLLDGSISVSNRLGYRDLHNAADREAIRKDLENDKKNGINLLSLAGASEKMKEVFEASFEAIVNYTLKRLPVAIKAIDPPVSPFLSEPRPTLPPPDSAAADVTAAASLAAGAVAGTTRPASVRAAGRLTASWSGPATFRAATLTAPSATVRDAAGNVVGSGAVALAAAAELAAAGGSYRVTGTGSLSFYGAAGAALGAGGEWADYTAAVTGNATFTTSGGLTLNGAALPAGTYTITTTSATLTGSGATSTPSFAGSASVAVTDGTVGLGTGAETYDGFTGTLAVTGDGTDVDAVTLNGTAAHVLRVTAPGGLAADQNNPVTFTPAVGTSLAGDYTVSVEAPEGWTVTADATGRFTVTPAAGLPAGDYPVRVVARSKANPDRVATTTALVAVTPTAPGLALDVTPDPLFTVSYNGAELPTAFRAEVRNLGPGADAYTVAITGLPAGFRVLSSGSGLTVPAGKTGALGLYLEPTAGTALPAPGTVLSFTVTATSTTDPSITQTETVTFTMPAVHAVTVTVTPAAITTTPGVPATATLTLKNVGNVDEAGVALAVTAPAGLAVAGLSPQSLAVGRTVTLTVTFTPDAGTPLNTSLAATITATTGTVVQRVVVPVSVAVPGAAAIGTAAEAAGRLGQPDLAARLRDLSTALTGLVQNPESRVFKGQATAALDTIARLLAANQDLAQLAPAVAADAARLAGATAPADVQAAVVALGNTLGTVGATLADAANTRFTIGFERNSQVGRPQVPTEYRLVLQNTGAATTTYDLAVSGLPAGVTAAFSADAVTLDPGQVAQPTLTLTSTSTTELSPFTFTVTATARGAAGITRSAEGAFTVRDALVQVTAVTTDPPFTDPGGTVRVTARVLNAVNKQQEARASFTVTAPGGAVVFTSNPVPVTLTVLTTLTTVDLGTFDTTGFARGDYAIAVTVTDAAGTPISGATGRGQLLVGSPVTAGLSVSPTTLPAGTGTVTNTLVVASQTSLVGPLGVVSLTDLPGAGGVVKNGHYVYASGTTGIRVFDITDPANPQLIRTFGSSATTLKIRGDKLYALNWSGASLLIYSMADPENPQLLGTAKYNGVDGIPYALAWNMVVTDTHVFASLWRTTQLIGNPQDIKFQTGDVIAIDITNPTAPVFVSAMLNTYGTTNDGIGQFLNADNNGGDGNLWEIVQVDANTLLVAGSTAKGDNTQIGSGVVHVIDISNPAQMAIVRTLTIPGTVQAVGLSIEGNRAFVTASQGGWNDPAPPNNADFTGNLVLATLDISDRRNPVLINSEVQNRSSVGPYSLHTVPLGNGLFAFSSQGNGQEQSALFVVDASNPTNLITSRTTIPAINAFGDLEGAGNYLYSTSPSGLIIYQVDAPDAIPATARVTVPNGVSVVTGSFNTPPTRTVTGPDGLTLEWEFAFAAGDTSRTITWQSTVLNVQPGRSRAVATNGTVSFVSQGTSGQAALADQFVTGAQIIGVTPAVQTVAPGAATTYTVMLANPTAADVTYTLSVQGVPAGWVSLPASVSVPANGTGDVTLTLTTPAFAALTDYGFSVTATAGGATDSSAASLTIAGQPVAPDPQSYGVVATMTPTATAGRGTKARYVVRLTNTGSTTETFDLAAALPAGVAGVFDRDAVVVPPGAGNFREVTLTVTPAAGADAGDFPVGVTAASEEAAATANGMLKVAAAGVTVALDRRAGAPGESFTATVTNTGTAADTFDLSAAGPGGLVATLGDTAVTLQPGESRTVTLTTTPAAFAVQGALGLTVAARSQSAPDVVAGDSAALAVPATAGLTAALDQNPRTLPAPGPADFLLTVNNTGNTEDQYVAEITGTTGPVTAALIGLDGLPTQAIPSFLLPGLASGAIRLRTNMTGNGSGTVTIVVRSLTDPSRTATVTATVAAGVPAPPAVQRRYAVGAGPGGGPRVQVFDAATDRKLFDFFAYDDTLRGGVAVATADITGDGVEDIITGAGDGGGPHVKVFDGATGAEVASWFAYDPTFRGGVWVAAADLDGDGTAEVVTGAGVGGGPLVRVWRVAGGAAAQLREFLAFDAASRGGATVAVGVGADGRAVIAAGSGPGAEARVRTFDPATGALLADVAAFEPSFLGGVYLAAGDVMGTGGATQFLAGPGVGGGPRLRAFAPDGAGLADIFAGPMDARAGLTVAALDREDEPAAVLVGAGNGAFRGRLAGGGLGDLSRVALFDNFAGGVFVG